MPTEVSVDPYQRFGHLYIVYASMVRYLFTKGITCGELGTTALLSIAQSYDARSTLALLRTLLLVLYTSESFRDGIRILLQDQDEKEASALLGRVRILWQDTISIAERSYVYLNSTICLIAIRIAFANQAES